MNEMTILAIRASGLPEPVKVPVDELRRALLQNPTFLLDTLRSALESASKPTAGSGAGGLEPGQTPTVGVLPQDTPIYKMVAATQVDKLSPAAMKLTKQDLLDLGGWSGGRKIPSQLGLTVEDINTIRDVFSSQLTSSDGLSGAGLACCCCPCCSAAAVTMPELNFA